MPPDKGQSEEDLSRRPPHKTGMVRILCPARRLNLVFFVSLLLSVGAWAEPGFDEKYERDYNIFNPVNQFAPDNPLNPFNQYAPDNPFNPINQLDPGNPANGINGSTQITPLIPSINTIPITR
jgi:hypothetical protein